jgi:hypothetical protein
VRSAVGLHNNDSLPKVSVKGPTMKCHRYQSIMFNIKKPRIFCNNVVTRVLHENERVYLTIFDFLSALQIICGFCFTFIRKVKLFVSNLTPNGVKIVATLGRIMF